MKVPALPTASGPVRKEDGLVVLRGATWADYQRVLQIRGERPVPRLAFLEGALQFMSPSKSHEQIKSMIGRLLEVYLLEAGIDFMTVGAWTLEDKPLEAAAEADESYIFTQRQPAQGAQRPDLAIEVIWTSGGIDKLEVYRRLAVREVWFWEDDQLSLYVLEAGTYRQVERSVALPELNLAELLSYLDRQSTSQAMHEYRQALAARRGP